LEYKELFNGSTNTAGAVVAVIVW